MADQWQTYPFEFRGGLITNLSPLQLGSQAPGSARVLRNFEPSVLGGYRRILGYEKYSASLVPSYGTPLVHGASQTGTSLIIASAYTVPEAGDQLTIAGVTGTYTIAAGGVAYNSLTKRATLTLTTSLATSPADKAAVTFLTNSGKIIGVAAWNNSVLAVRNDNIYKSTGVAWTKINVPNYGTALVNGASQTGTTLNIDGLNAAPQLGDTFTISGVNLVYTIVAAVTVTGGAAAVTIDPALDTSPANNAPITFIATSRSDGFKNRFEKYRIGTTEKVAGVDGVNAPFIYDNATFKVLTTAPNDVIGAEHVVWFKNQLFFAKGDRLTFTAPYTDDDFRPANGAGVIGLGSAITGLVVFREQLIIFSQDKITQLVGNTSADFVLKPITINIGCIDTDTIQEIGSDIMFLAPDGLRLLSGTDAFGDYGLAVVSKVIQSEMTDFIRSSTSFASVVVKQKSQYRIFGYSETITSQNALGVLGTQTAGDQTGVVAWAELRGIKAYVADGDYNGRVELLVFANDSGYVYQMEKGNSLDGDNIIASFSTPFVYLNDPRIRKTFYKLFLYTDPDGGLTTSVNLRLDFDDSGVIQPETIIFSNVSGTVGVYGSSNASYGTTTYGGSLKKLFQAQLVGSGFAASLQFVSNSTGAPFSLDAATLEFSTHDRR